jgi:Peptidase propeptide and YPEB domain
MKFTKTSILVGLTVSLLGLAGINRLVSAAPSVNPVAILKEQVKFPEKEASDRDSETNDDAKEQQESKQLEALAKITPQQAQQAALVAQPGQVSRIQLENEDRNLVYTIVIGQKNVTIDAGNAKVLDTEDSKSENNDKNQLRSSIQVPNSGDGERKDK